MAVGLECGDSSDGREGDVVEADDGDVRDRMGDGNWNGCKDKMDEIDGREIICCAPSPGLC